MRHTLGLFHGQVGASYWKKYLSENMCVRDADVKKIDGVMIGRAAYHTPYFLADIEKEIFKNDNVPSRQEIIEKLIPYIGEELKKGTRLNQIMRHTLGLFHGQTGSNFWKRYLSENLCVRDADIKKIDHIMDKVKLAPQAHSVGQID